jgi:hypothetical protein
MRAPALVLLLLLHLLAPSLLAFADDEGASGEGANVERDVIDMTPADPPVWGFRYLSAPFVAMFRGRGYMYAPREIEIDTTPAGGFVDLFYVRSGFQKRFEQGEAPLTVIVPSRVEAGPRDSLTIRAFADGYRQENVTMRLRSSVPVVNIDLEPLPNWLDGIAYRYFAGRASVSFLTRESLTFRLQEADDGFSVILNETAISKAAEASLSELRNPLVDEGYAQQLGEDLMVRLVLAVGDLDGVVDVRSRQFYDAPRDLHAFALDFVPSDAGAAVERAQAALGSLSRRDVSGCALRFDDTLREGLDPGALARALSPQGEFTDAYLRAAMRRLGEVSVDGVVDFVDGSQYRPSVPLELEMSISNARGAKGFLALLRAFATALEGDDTDRRESLRSLVAPELRPAEFDGVLDRADEAERACAGAV